MNRLLRDRAEAALVDVSTFDIALDGADRPDLGRLPAAVAALLQDGYCACFGTGRVLQRAGFDLDSDREVAYRLLEDIFRRALSLLPIARYSVTPHPMTIEKMDVDGFNLNESFSHDGQIASRAFQTAKCIHFDAATPFIGNIYGPNKNIVGGHPFICDVRQYCLDKGLEPSSIVETIPNNYNVRVREQHYAELLRHYTHAYRFSLESDIIVIMTLNELAFGVAHGATDPLKSLPGEAAERPIRHIELQYSEEQHYEEWYDHYRLVVGDVGDYRGEDLSLFCYGPMEGTFENFIDAGMSYASS